jgi:hypothetical protein
MKTSMVLEMVAWFIVFAFVAGGLWLLSGQYSFGTNIPCSGELIFHSAIVATDTFQFRIFL